MGVIALASEHFVSQSDKRAAPRSTGVSNRSLIEFLHQLAPGSHASVAGNTRLIHPRQRRMAACSNKYR